MTEYSQRILSDFQIRKTEKQKSAFRDYLCGVLRDAGYAPRVETVKNFGTNNNVVVGDPESSKVIFSAHYDTCAVLPIPNFITPRNFFIYILYNILLCFIMFAMVGAAMLLVGLILVFVFHAPSEILPAILPLVAYAVCIFCIVWMMGGGAANKHTVNDNTSGVVTLLEAALATPEEFRDKACFVFFDNEEKGIFGSKGFVTQHRSAKKDALNINFDCIGDGSSIQFFPAKRVKRDEAACSLIESSFLPVGGRTVELVRSFGFYPSDNGSFKRGVGVCALRHSPIFGWYMSRIHTNTDTVLEGENVELLRDGVVRMISKL